MEIDRTCSINIGLVYNSIFANNHFHLKIYDQLLSERLGHIVSKSITARMMWSVKVVHGHKKHFVMRLSPIGRQSQEHFSDVLSIEIFQTTPTQIQNGGRQTGCKWNVAISTWYHQISDDYGWDNAGVLPFQILSVANRRGIVISFAGFFLIMTVKVYCLFCFDAVLICSTHLLFSFSCSNECF